MNYILYDSLPSTQQHLIAMLKNNIIKEETCIIATHQHSGIGSRGNQWNSVESGLYYSFCKYCSTLPDDLNKQSMSIFFGFIVKENLAQRGSKVWLKYPNDLYIDSNKIGGILCNIVGDVVVCGIGINIIASHFAHLESNIIIDSTSFVKQYIASISNYTWSDVLIQYKKEFHKNNDFSFHHNGNIISLKKTTLLDDGAILYNGKAIHHTRFIKNQ